MALVASYGRPYLILFEKEKSAIKVVSDFRDPELLDYSAEADDLLDYGSELNLF